MIALAAVIGSVGLVWAGVSDSPYWFLALVLTLPLGMLFGLIVVRGRVAVPISRTESVGRSKDERVV